MEDLEMQIKQDILQYMNISEKMSYNDKIDFLMMIFKKHILINKSDVMLHKKDLQEIISRSKQLFSEMPVPVEMDGSDTPLNQMEIPNLCVVESTIAFLNKNNCLKKLPKFKYKKR